jgi:hypothetical protein
VELVMFPRASPHAPALFHDVPDRRLQRGVGNDAPSMCSRLNRKIADSDN